jgi:hypothetical protein
MRNYLSTGFELPTLATGFDLQRNKNGEFINDLESLACVVQWFSQKNNNSTDF